MRSSLLPLSGNGRMEIIVLFKNIFQTRSGEGRRNGHMAYTVAVSPALFFNIS